MSVTTARVLVALPQSPMDPSNGAARTVRTIAEILAGAGFHVRVVALGGSEAADQPTLARMLAGLGIARNGERRRVPEWAFAYRGVDYRILDGAGSASVQMRAAMEQRYDDAFDRELREFSPQALFTYGGSDSDLRRHDRARRTGCRIIFAVFNVAYLEATYLRDMDVVLTPSRYITELYHSALGISSVALPSPLNLADVLAPRREPVDVTMVNPTIDKGAMFVARIAEELGRDFPDISLRIVPSRGSARLVVLAGLNEGFDLRRHRNILLGTMVTYPRDIYAKARLLLVPSVVEEASGRVVAEALVNGVPPLVSERGGLPENAGDGGCVLRLPDALTRLTRRPVGAHAVQTWLEMIVTLVRDENRYRHASARASDAGLAYHPDHVGPRYVRLFAALCGH